MRRLLWVAVLLAVGNLVFGCGESERKPLQKTSCSLDRAPKPGQRSRR